jgi:hypothetical protein
MQSPIILAIYALAAARITRMVTTDRLFDRPRRAFIVAAWRRAHPWIKAEPPEEQGNALAMVLSNHAKDPPLSAYLISCPWCMSIWIGGTVAPLVWFWGYRPWMLIPAFALAVSYLTGFLASREG